MTASSRSARSRSKRNFLIFFAVIMAGFFCLAWFVFGVQKQFIDERVDEAAPFVIASSTTSPTNTASNSDTMASTSTTPTTSTTPVAAVAYSGTFIDRSHPARGTASVLTDGTTSFLRFEEFETDNGPDVFVYLARGVNRDTTESKLDADIINLGKLKGNIGDQNYEIPADVDLSEYDTVVLWCKRFGVAFGTADLIAQTADTTKVAG